MFVKLNIGEENTFFIQKLFRNNNLMALFANIMEFQYQLG